MDRMPILCSAAAYMKGMEVAMRTRLLIVALIVTGGLLSGCAFGDRQAELGYPPAAEQGAMGAQAAPAPA